MIKLITSTTRCVAPINVPLAGDKAEVEMSKQGIRALIISAVIGFTFWVLFIICIAGVNHPSSHIIKKA